jgi:hypothetical protein
MLVRNMSTGQEHDVDLEVPPQEYNDRTLLPIRVVSEALGCKVGWDELSGTVIITTADYTPQRKRKTIVIGE